MATSLSTGARATKRKRTAAVLLFLSAGYIATTLNIQGFIGMLPLVQREFAISGAQAGMYTSFYFLSATAIAVFAGRIVDRLGARLGIAIGAGTVGFMMLLHAISPLYGVILFFSFVTGIGFSVITPSVSKGVMENVSATRRAGAMGIAHGIGGSGALFGTALMPALGEAFGWRPVLAVGGLIALVICASVYRFYSHVAAPESTRASDTESEEKAHSEGGSFLHDVRTLLRDGRLVTVCILGAVFGMSISSVTSHLALFLNQDLGYTPALAGIALAAFHVGGMAGQPSWGFINDKLLGRRRRLGLIILTLGVSALSFLFAFLVATGLVPFVAIVGLALLMGFLVLGMPSLYFTTVSELAPGSLTGVATGVALVLSRSGVVVSAPVFGLLADVTGDYTVSWLVLGGAALLTTLFVIALGRRYPMGGTSATR